MSEKRINSRVILKHDTEAHWNSANNFIPLAGEVIIYDADDTHSYLRYKRGDGITVAKNLPFEPYIHMDGQIPDGAVMIYNSAMNRVEYSSFTIASIQQWVKDYIETYMSTEIEVDSENENATSLYTNGKTKEVMTEDGNLWLYVGGTNE
jgi:hypothetical protein